MTGLVTTADIPDDAYEIQETGIVFNRPLSYEQYERTLELASMLRECGTWALADTLIAAIDTLGESASQLFSRLPYEPPYLNNLLWIGRAIPPAYRVNGAPVSFHQIVAPAIREALANGDTAGIEIARTWLIDAVEREMTRKDLQDEYKTFTLPPSMRIGNTESLPLEEPSDYEIVPQERPAFTIAAARSVAYKMFGWARRNDCPSTLLGEFQRVFGFEEII